MKDRDINLSQNQDMKPQTSEKSPPKDDIDSLKQLLADNSSSLNFYTLNQSDDKTSSSGGEDISPSEEVSEERNKQELDLSFFKVDEKTLEMIKQIPIDLTVDDESDKDEAFLKTWKLNMEEEFDEPAESEQTENEEETDLFTQTYETADLQNALNKLSIINGEEESSSNDTENSEENKSTSEGSQ